MLFIVIILFSKYSAVISLLCCACDSTRPYLYIISFTPPLCLAVIRRARSLRCLESPIPGFIDQLFHASARMTTFLNNCFSNIIMQQREPRSISPCNQIRTYKAQPLTLSPQRQEPVCTPSPVLGTHICKRMLYWIVNWFYKMTICYSNYWDPFIYLLRLFQLLRHIYLSVEVIPITEIHIFICWSYSNYWDPYIYLLKLFQLLRSIYLSAEVIPITEIHIFICWSYSNYWDPYIYLLKLFQLLRSIYLSAEVIPITEIHIFICWSYSNYWDPYIYLLKLFQLLRSIYLSAEVIPITEIHIFICWSYSNYWDTFIYLLKLFQLLRSIYLSAEVIPITEIHIFICWSYSNYWDPYIYLLKLYLLRKIHLFEVLKLLFISPPCIWMAIRCVTSFNWVVGSINSGPESRVLSCTSLVWCPKLQQEVLPYLLRH